MTDDTKNAESLWDGSRKGAWASRGFHYQHLVTTLILIRQWAGTLPSGSVVPEGFEDCVVELPDREVWIQAKSRKTGTFSEAELKAIYTSIASKISTLRGKKRISTVAVFEQPCPDIVPASIHSILDRSQPKLVIFSDPGAEAISLILKDLPIAEVIAEGIVNDLYKLVADVSQGNASLAFDKRRRISTSEVERRIFERLEAADPSAIDGALLSGALRPVDFTTPIAEPSFYQGVKVAPGHVASGLVFRRSNETENVIGQLRRRRQVLISGPSGAGKSALLWLTANSLSGDMRWYQITANASPSDAEAIVRFIRARRSSETSPIGIIFDEVNSTNCDLWDVLVAELRAMSSVYFLGSIRQEDTTLISSRSEAEFIPVSLGRELAETVWAQLSADGQTSSMHWLEPYEQSRGLMLEYVHLLTQGKRLAEVIRGQVELREREGRLEELAIIRAAAVISARGGEIDVKKLLEILALDAAVAQASLKRLIDEHIVRESRPGILGGLHLLRSEALEAATHDGAVYLRDDTLWRALPAATVETMPHIIRAILCDAIGPAEQEALQELSKILSTSREIHVWVSVLTGLGFGTLERGVLSLIAMLEQYGVQRGQWSLASMFADPGIEIPDLSKADTWQKMRDAMLAFRSLPKDDLRAKCLALLPGGTQMPVCRDLTAANKLLSCFVPICGGDAVPVEFPSDFIEDYDGDIREIAAFLDTARLLDESTVLKLTDRFGGEEALLARFRTQTPWVTTPVVEEHGPHGRTVRADLLYVSDGIHKDIHDTVCEICETLIALSPTSAAAASQAINPKGQPVSIAGFTMWSKNMPRENIPAKSRVAWNVAFRQIMLARATANSLSDYVAQMADLVRRTERVFRSFTEKWISAKSIPNRDNLAAEINSIVEAANALSYAVPSKSSSEMTSPVDGAGTDDTLGALIAGVLGNLVPRLARIPGEGEKSAAMFAASLGIQARAHHQSPIWRMTSLPPTSELEALSERLEDVSNILHEFAHDSGPTVVQYLVSASKRGSLGKAVKAGSRAARLAADQRFSEKLREVEDALKERGWSAQCISRSVNSEDNVYWPPKEIAVLVEISDFESDMNYVADGLLVGTQVVGTEWVFRIVPVMDKRVLSPMALKPSRAAPIPDLGFEKDWADAIALPFQPVGTVADFDAAIAACALISGVLAGRGLDNLHPDEEKALDDAKAAFKASYEALAEASKATGAEHLELGIEYLAQIWGQVNLEFETQEAGEQVDCPICMDAYHAAEGAPTERTGEVAAIRLLMLQGECRAGVHP